MTAFDTLIKAVLDEKKASKKNNGMGILFRESSFSEGSFEHDHNHDDDADCFCDTRK